MSERKYRQRGYMEGYGGADDKRSRAPKAKSEPVPREMRTPNMPGFKEVVKCARCGQPLGVDLAPDARCSRCGVDLHSCAQCVSFDTGQRFECAQPVPARVAPKDARNTCTFFAPRVTIERETRSAGAPSIRKAFDDLFR